MDRTAIATAVYVAFSAAVVGGIWTQLDGREIAIVLGVDALLLGSAFGGTWLFSVLDQSEQAKKERAAYAARRYFRFRTVIPCHYRTFPLLEQSAGALIAGLPGVKVIEPQVLVPIEP